MRIKFKVFEQVSCKECDLFGIFQFDLKRIIKRIDNASLAIVLRLPYTLNSLITLCIKSFQCYKKKLYPRLNAHKEKNIMYVTYIAKHYSFTTYDFCVSGGRT